MSGRTILRCRLCDMVLCELAAPIERAVIDLTHGQQVGSLEVRDENSIRVEPINAGYRVG